MVSAHRVGGLDNSELYLRKLFRRYALVTSTGKHVVTRIYRHSLGRIEQHRLLLFKKVFYCPQGLAAAARPWGRCTPVPPPPTS